MNLDEGLNNATKPKSLFKLLRRGETGILNGFFFALSVGLITSGLVMVIWCLLSIEPASVRDRFYNESHRISVDDDALIWISAMTGGLFFVYLLGVPILKRLKTKHQTPPDSQRHSEAAKEESQ
jgi:hypothetical protein